MSKSRLHKSGLAAIRIQSYSSDSVSNVKRAAVGEGAEQNDDRSEKLKATKVFEIPTNQIFWDCSGGEHPAFLQIDKLRKQCKISRTKRGGPGGQHRNKASTAVVMKHLATKVSGEGSERRSQVENERNAIRRLRMALATKVRSAHLQIDGTFLPLGWEPRNELLSRLTRKGKLEVSATNEAMPAVLTNILDGMYAHELQVSSLCEDINKKIPSKNVRVSPNEIVLFLAKHPAALHLINRERLKLTMPTLKVHR